MTVTQKELVRSSYAQVAAVADTAAELFYARLFELDPGLRRLFKGEAQAQGRKLVQMIGLAVAGLDRWHALAPALRELGRRHESYGVREEDYETVGAALLWALEQGLGPSFTPQVRAAWVAVYAKITSAMLHAAAPTRPLECVA